METAVFDPEKWTKESREAWSVTAVNYDRMSRELFSGFTESFMGFADLTGGEKVLDVACGSGLASLAAAQKVGPKGSVVGIDLAPGMVQVAAGKAKSLGLKLEFQEMNAEKLTFPDGSFDAVISQLGLMLFAKPEAALKEMVRVVRKGGVVGCLVQGVPERMLFTSLIMRNAVKHVPQMKVPGAPTLYSFGPPGVLDKALQEAGLGEVQAARKEGTFSFDSPQAYWDTLTDGAGRMRSILQSLEPRVRDAIQADTLRDAERCRKDGRLEIPWEVVMARGTKPE